MTDVKIPNKILDSFNTRQEVELRKVWDTIYDGVLENLQDSGDLLISNLGDVGVLNPDDRDLLQFDFGLQEWVNVSIEEIYAPQITNVVFAGPTTGSPAFPAFRSLVEADIPAIPSTKISDSTVTGRSLITAANAAAGRTVIGAAADAEVVKLSGDQTVSGTKTFSSLRASGSRTLLGAGNETYALGLSFSTNLANVYFIGASNSATPDLIFSNAGGTEGARITNAGNIAVGTTSDAPFGQTSRLTLSTTGNTACQQSYSAGTGSVARASARFFTGSANSFVYYDLFDLSGVPGATVTVGLGVSYYRWVFGATEVGRVLPSGNWGFGGNTSPTAAIDNNGFSKLGESAPKIKQKKLTGTTASTVSTSASVAHGLTRDKIIGYTFHYTSAGGSIYPHNREDTPTLLVTTSIDATNLVVSTGPSTTTGLNRPFVCLITYEE